MNRDRLNLGFCYDDIGFITRGIVMRAFEVMATLSNSKQLLLDSDLDWDTSRVKFGIRDDHVRNMSF